MLHIKDITLETTVWTAGLHIKDITLKTTVWTAGLHIKDITLETTVRTAEAERNLFSLNVSFLRECSRKIKGGIGLMR